MPCRVSVGQRVQPALAVDQRPRAGRADLPARQAQLGQQRGHLRPARDERLGADVHRLAADPLGAQHAAEPVGRVEHRDRRVRPGGDPQPVRRDQTRNPAADNGNTMRIHSECTNATTSVMTPGSVPGSTPWPRLNTWPAGARVDRAPAVLDDGARRALRHRQSRPTAPPGRGCPAARCPAARARRRRSARCASPRPTTGSRRRPRDIAPSSSAVPTPKCVIGTPAPASAANTLRAVRQHVAAVVGQRQRAGPRVEHLDRVHPGRRPGSAGRRWSRRSASSSTRARSRVRRASSPWCARGAGSGRPRRDRTPA